MRIKEFAKISKVMLRQLSNAIEVITTERVQRGARTSEDFTSLEFIEPTLMREYAKVISTHSGTIYSINENEKEVIWEEITRVKKVRLSKSQILQFMFYHFLPIEYGQFICNISEQSIADNLGCSVRTVRNNNVIFQQLGMIDFSRAGKNINILLIRYEDSFKEGNHGYMEVAYSRFEEIQRIDNVNALRQEIRQELIYDNHEIRRIMNKEEVPCKITLNDFKNFTPTYTHYKAKIEEIIQKGTGVFRTIFENNCIFFVPTKDYKNGKILKIERDAEYLDTVLEFLEKHEQRAYFKHKDMRDLIQLAHEYSINHVIQALEVFILDYLQNEGSENIRNVGGKIRVMIRILLDKEKKPKAPEWLMA